MEQCRDGAATGRQTEFEPLQKSFANDGEKKSLEGGLTDFSPVREKHTEREIIDREDWTKRWTPFNVNDGECSNRGGLGGNDLEESRCEASSGKK